MFFSKNRNFKKILLAVLLFSFLSIGLMFFANSVLAASTGDAAQSANLGLQQVGEGTGLGTQDIRLTIAKIIRVALGLLGLVALGIILYGGYLYMTAGGNDEQVGTAKNIIKNGVIGLAIILSAYAIASFVISSLLKATGTNVVYPSHCSNSICDEDETCMSMGDNYPINCGGSCKACNVYCPNGDCELVDSFYVRSLPTPGQKCVTNIGLRVVFSQAVDMDSLVYGDTGKNKIKVMKGSEEVPGKWNAVGDSGEEIIFKPDLPCGSSCSMTGCFDPSSDYTLKFPGSPDLTTIKSVSASALSCVKTKSSVGCGPVNFKSGTTCDSDAPLLDIISETPVAGNTNAKTFVSSTDSSGIRQIRLYADTPKKDTLVDYKNFEGCQNHVEDTLLWYTPLVNQTETRKLTVRSYDDDSNFGEQSKEVVLMPMHCDDHIKNFDEKNIDCGGSCLSCDTCSKNSDCRSGYCGSDGKCLDKVTIRNVDPISAAKGSFVTISGYYFGDEIGTVEFNDKTTGAWLPANVVSCGQAVDAWTPWEVIVENPLSAGQTGPIRIKTNSYTAAESYKMDSTDDLWPPKLKDFTATDKIIPSLCPITPNSGVSKEERNLTGKNFGPLNNDKTRIARDNTASDYVYFGIPGDGKNGKAQITDWGTFNKVNSLENVKVLVPGLSTGWVGVSLFNNGVKSNTVSFLMNSNESKDPHISAISPSVGAKGEYITITGENFGLSRGNIYFYEDGDTSSNCLASGKCFKGSFDFPSGCDDKTVWNSRQIIVKFPENKGAIGNEYLVKVERGSDLSLSQPGIYFNLVAGDPKPGICNLTPNVSAVPTNQTLEIIGERLTSLDNSKNPSGYDVAVWWPIKEDKLNEFTNANYNLKNPAADYIKVVNATDRNGADQVVNIDVPSSTPYSQQGSIYLKSDLDLPKLSFNKSGFSISFWIKFNKHNGEDTFTLFSKAGNDTDVPEYNIIKHWSGELMFASYAKDYYPIYFNTTSLITYESNWHNFVWVNGGDSSLLYYNGVLVSENKKVSEKEPNVGNGALFINKFGSKLEQDINYSLDDIRIYQRKLNADDVKSLFENTKQESVLPANIYFWKNGALAKINDDNTLPLSSNRLKADSLFKIENLSPNGQKITGIKIPVGTNTGPVLVERGSDGKVSNQINFRVQNCVENGIPKDSLCEDENLQCCAVSAGEGSCISKNQICIGKARSAGYVWRFTTKNILPVPRVVEACKSNSVTNYLPSPSPNMKWDQTEPKNNDHESVCRQALVTVEFNAQMDNVSINNGSVVVRKCASVAGNVCNNPGSPILMKDTVIGGDGSGAKPFNIAQTFNNIREGIKLLPQNASTTAGVWNDDSWYQVVLTSDIKSDPYDINDPANTKVALSSDRPCGKITVNGQEKDSAYCFVFKTGHNDCQMKEAGILPYSWWTTVLEVPIVKHDITGTSDLIWESFGLSTQKCILMDTSRLPWNWDVWAKKTASAPQSEWPDTDYSRVSTRKSVKIIGKPALQQFDALRNTSAVGLFDLNGTAANSVFVHSSVIVTSSLNQTGITFNAISPLTIDLSNPQVVDFWPSCLQTCVNAEVGVKFNTTMTNVNVNSAVKLYKCNDENCSSVSEAYNEGVLVRDTGNTFTSDSNYTILKIANFKESSALLATNTLYKVVISSSSPLYSASIFNDPSLISKPFKEGFSWKFKTGAVSCKVDKVQVLPLEYTASYIGDKKVYAATPLANLDKCGYTKINPWSVNWDWNVPALEQSIATVNKFTVSGVNSYCTDRCVRKGSDLPSQVVRTVGAIPVCGNYVVEAGEDCDPPNKDLGCGLNCVNIGNWNYDLLDKTNGVKGKCGDGIVNTTSSFLNGTNDGGLSYNLFKVTYGEECDPTSPTASIRIGCGSNCLRTGSSQTPDPKNPSASICGNGSINVEGEEIIGAGEDCDLGIAASSANPASSYNCSSNCLHLGSVISKRWCADNAYSQGGFTTSSFNSACSKALSQCGDRILDYDEDPECEIAGDGRNVNVNDCNEYCLRKAVNVNTPANEKTCTPNSEGCDSNGNYLGSDLAYKNPSVCGDGFVGTGENPFCENTSFQTKKYINPKVSPWAIAVGQNLTNLPVGTSEILNLSAHINAVASGDIVKNGTATGFGKYLVPCGFHSDSACQAAFGQNGGQYGVADNSCCFLRSEMTDYYPKPNGATNVCPNTVISATFNQVINESTLNGNALLAYGLTQNQINSRKAATPTLIGTYNLPSSDNFIDGDYLYSIKNSSGASAHGILEIYNLNSVSAPVLLGKISTSSGVAYLSVAVENSYAFVGTTGGVDVFNVANVKSPKFVYHLNTDDDAVDLKFLTPDYLSVNGGKFSIWKIFNANNFVKINQKNYNSRLENSIYITPKIKVYSGYLYIMDPNSGIKIYNFNDYLISSTPRLLGELTGNKFENFDVAGNILYTISNNNILKANKITWVDGTANFTELGNDFVISNGFSSPATQLQINGDFAYIANADKFEIINVRIPSSYFNILEVVGFSQLKFNLQVGNKIVYLADYLTETSGKFKAYDLSGLFNPPCTKDVTDLVISSLSYNSQSSPWYIKIWDGVVNFFKNLFGLNVYAVSTPRDADNPIVKWCVGSEVNSVKVISDSSTTTSRINFDLGGALQPDTDYAVILTDKIKDSRGVSIGKDANGKAWGWRFITDNIGICAIDNTVVLPVPPTDYEYKGTAVSINPTEVLFTVAQSTTTLEAQSYAKNGQKIQSVNGYEWNYIWKPSNNPYVLIQQTDSNLNIIKAENRNGETNVVASANVTVNNYANYTIGETGTPGSAAVTIMLCQNPWPPIGESIYNATGEKIYPYEDSKDSNSGFNFNSGINGQFDGSKIPEAVVGKYFNFKFYYCADSGVPSSTADDLPYLRPAVQPGRPTSYLTPNKNIFGIKDLFNQAAHFALSLILPEPVYAAGICGDGIVNSENGEECDDGPYNGVRNGCLPDCKINRTLTDCVLVRGGVCDCNGNLTGTCYQRAMIGSKFGLCHTCPTTCTPPTTCPPCGNGKIDVGEPCDGANLNGDTCQKHGFDGGNLICSAKCEAVIDALCYKCGDGKINGNEVCDPGAPNSDPFIPADLGDKTCADLKPGNLTSGVVKCKNDCSGYDISSCTYCGDNICNGAETWQTCGEDCTPPALIGKALKRFIFTNSKNNDAIGIQIFPNPDHLSVLEWFGQNKDLTGGLSVQSLQVDGYDAITDGANIFIDALNYSTSTVGEITKGGIYSNIYMFSRNLGAGDETLNVYEQIITNLKFNTNLTNYGYCGSDVLNPDYKITCTTDFDCPRTPEQDSTFISGSSEPSSYPKVCSNQVDKLKRNYARLRDLKKIQDALLNYARYNDVMAWWSFDDYVKSGNSSVPVNFYDKVNASSLSCAWDEEKCASSVVAAKFGTGIKQEKSKNTELSYSVSNLSDDKLALTNKELSIVAWGKNNGGKNSKFHFIFRNSKKGAPAENALKDYDFYSYLGSDNLYHLGFEAPNSVKFETPGFTFSNYTEDFNAVKIQGNKISIFYNNNNVYSSTTVKDILSPSTEATAVKVGSEVNLESYSYTSGNGFMDELIVFNRSLSDGELLAYRDNFVEKKKLDFPSMAEGSFLAGQTLSVWNQSWNKLGSDLGLPLPSDPINKLGTAGTCSSSTNKFCVRDSDCNTEAPSCIPTTDANCEKCVMHDAATGWSAENRRFSFACDSVRSFAYRYIKTKDSLGFNLRAQLELTGLENSWDIQNKNDFINAFVDPIKVYLDSVCSVSSGEVTSMNAGKCGDGIVNLNNGEECDPAGSTRRYNDTTCVGGNKYKLMTCNKDCLWSKTIDANCYDDSAKLCGNAKIDSGETCDDGWALNGMYNHCDKTCKTFGTANGYCGNGKLEAGELCDPTQNKICKNGINNYSDCSKDDDCNSACFIASKNEDDGKFYFYGRIRNISSQEQCLENICEYVINNNSTIVVADVEGNNEFQRITKTDCETYPDIYKAQYINLKDSSTDKYISSLKKMYQLGQCKPSFYNNTNVYAHNKKDSCSWDCQNYGDYCGDGIVQSDEGEACDGEQKCVLNNVSGVRHCNKDCQKTKNGTLMYYNFDDVNDLSKDSSGNNNYIGPESMVDLGATSGMNNTGGLSFDASYLKIDPNYLKSVKDGWTAEMWVNTNSSGAGAKYLMSNLSLESGKLAGNGFQLYMNSGFTYFTLTLGADTYNLYNEQVKIENNSWHQIVIELSPYDIYLIVDGKQEHQALNGANKFLPFSTEQKIYVGAFNSSKQFSYKGTIDELSFYNYMVPTSKIIDDYNNSGWSCDIATVGTNYTSMCGNGKIDANEICDSSDKNGVPCELGSKETSCSYCSWDCKNIIDVNKFNNYDVNRNCGDGIIQTPYENCDPKLNGSICKNNCKSLCGNGIVEFGEYCEPKLNPGCNGNCYYDRCEYQKCFKLQVGSVKLINSCFDSAGNPITAFDDCNKNYSLGYCGDGVIDNLEVGINKNANNGTWQAYFYPLQLPSFNSVYKNSNLEECEIKTKSNGQVYGGVESGYPSANLTAQVQRKAQAQQAYEECTKFYGGNKNLCVCGGSNYQYDILDSGKSYTDCNDDFICGIPALGIDLSIGCKVCSDGSNNFNTSDTACTFAGDPKEFYIEKSLCGTEMEECNYANTVACSGAQCDACNAFYNKAVGRQYEGNPDLFSANFNPLSFPLNPLFKRYSLISQDEMDKQDTYVGYYLSMEKGKCLTRNVEDSTFNVCTPSCRLYSHVKASLK